MNPAAAHVNRIIGLETEYGVTGRLADGTVISPDDVARAMFRPVAEQYGSSNIFHPDGSRLYLDVGAHPEWATAECTTIDQLAAFVAAGDRIIDGLAVKAEGSLDFGGDGATIWVLKNNVDSVGNSYGAHENYLVGRDVVIKRLGALFLPFLITRQLICGAGTIARPGAAYPDIDESCFVISQRADHVWEAVSSATTRSRPIINTRDEPHADSSRWRRLHVIVGDSNMADDSLRLKIGSTLLVLEMIEAHAAPDGLELTGSIEQIHTVARDTTGRAPVHLDHSVTTTALAIQRAWCDAAGRWLDKRPEPDEGKGTPTAQLKAIHRLWTTVLDCLDSGDLTPIAGSVDWVAKTKLFDAYLDRGLTLGDAKLARLDYAYHDLRPGRSVLQALTDRGRINSRVSDSAIQAAIDAPPPTTRAAIRGRFLRTADRLGAPVTVDWMRVKLSRPEPVAVELPDPFATESAAVDELLEHMARHFPAQ
nr:Pup--protein ligase [Corynebacterium mendelii]